MWRKQDDIQRMLRDSAGEFLAVEHGTARFRERRSGDGTADLTMWAKMAEQGWTGILLSEESGGLGLGLDPALTLAEVLGAGLLNEPFVASAIMAATILDEVGAHPLTDAMVSGETLVLPAFQEKLNDWGQHSIATKLSASGEGYVLSGAKIFVSNWHPDATLLVTASLNGELAVVTVPAKVLGATDIAKTADGAAVASIRFENILLTIADILLRGEAAESAVLRANQRGILGICAQSEGLAKAMFDMTVEYVRQRAQFGQTLSSFQALRHAMVNLHIEIELASASWRRAAELLAAGNRQAAQAISMAKARTGSAVTGMGKASVQYHGAFGYTEDADVGLYVNTSLRLASWLGNAASHRDAAIAMHLEANDA